MLINIQCYLYLPAEQGLDRHIAFIALLLLFVLLLVELTDDADDTLRSFKFVRHEK